MNLGLLDILTTQQVDKLDLSKKSNTATDVLSGNSRSKFKDVLDAPVKLENSIKKVEGQGDSFPTSNDLSNFEGGTKLLSKKGTGATYRENISSSGEKTASPTSNSSDNDFLAASDTAANKFFSANISDNNLQVTNPDISGVLKDVYESIKQIKESGTNAISNLLMLQGTDNAESNATKLSGSFLSNASNSSSDDNEPHDIANNTIINDISNTLTNNLNQQDSFQNTNINKVDTQTVQEVVGNILPDAFKLSGELLSKIKSDKTGGDKVITKAVLEVAKNNAEVPDVSVTDVKSDQISILLQGKNDELSTDKANTDITKPDATKSDALAKTEQSRDNFVDNLQKNKDLSIKLDAKTNDTIQQQVQNLSEQITQVISHEKSSANNKDNGEQNISSYQNKITSELSNSAASSITSGDFVKFQKYIDSTHNSSLYPANKSLADDVLSQIKFGFSGTSDKDSKNISIQLHPKELGKIDIRMDTASDGKTRVSIMAENTDTLNLLQKEASTLRDMLQDTLKTDQSNLSFTFHDKGNEQWKQFMNESFSNSYGSQEEDLSQTSNNIGAYQYQSGMIAIDGLDIRV